MYVLPHHLYYLWNIYQDNIIAKVEKCDTLCIIHWGYLDIQPSTRQVRIIAFGLTLLAPRFVCTVYSNGTLWIPNYYDYYSGFLNTGAESTCIFRLSAYSWCAPEHHWSKTMARRDRTDFEIRMRNYAPTVHDWGENWVLMTCSNICHLVLQSCRRYFDHHYAHDERQYCHSLSRFATA